MTRTHGTTRSDDRWPEMSRELGRVGARRAASAAGELLGRPVRAAEPRPCPAVGDESLAGILFEVSGGLNGLVALLLPPAARDRLVSILCSGREVDLERADSALRELGNIVASRAVSGMADHLGARITLSVPTLVPEAAGRVVSRLLAEQADAASAFAVESELQEPGVRDGPRLVLAARAGSAGS